MSDIRSWLFPNGAAVCCLCKPFSYKACSEKTIIKCPSTARRVPRFGLHETQYDDCFAKTCGIVVFCFGGRTQKVVLWAPPSAPPPTCPASPHLALPRPGMPRLAPSAGCPGFRVDMSTWKIVSGRTASRALPRSRSALPRLASLPSGLIRRPRPCPAPPRRSCLDPHKPVGVWILDSRKKCKRSSRMVLVRITCRVQNPDIPRAVRVGAHGGVAGRGRAGLDANRTVRPGDKPPPYLPKNQDKSPERLSRSTNKRNPM